MSTLTASATDGIDPIRAAHISARIDRLPAVATLWRLVALLSIGGFFELYDLFQTAYVIPGLVDAHTRGRILGFIDEERVNVVELNLALQRLG